MLNYNRRRQTNLIIKKRLKQILMVMKSDPIIYKRFVHSNMLAKTKAFGCNRSNCHCCHPNKIKKC